MKLTIANKRLNQKPITDQEKAKYFKGIVFKTGNFSLDTFEKIIKNGYTITYIYKDDVFDRSNHYMTNNYLGTQFICVDIDSCPISPIEFIESIKYKPTLVHTTFSNLTQQKGGKWCFHLLYCFDEIIYGEENFKTAFKILTDDYKEYVDNAAKDCHRVIFTSNCDNENFIFHRENILYKVKDIFTKTYTESYDDLSNFFSESSDGKNNENAYKFNSTNNIQENEKKFPNGKTKSIGNNSFNLDNEFWEDLNGMTRSNFLNKYLAKFPYITTSIATEEQIFRTENGIVYEDWRNKEYYEVPSKYRYINGERKVVKVDNGNRTKSLMFDCLVFIKIIPNITKEYLVTMLVNEVFKHYNNKDKELTNYKIIGIAKYGWDLKDNITINPIRKNFKIKYTEDMRKMQAVGVLNKLMKDDEIGNNLDLSISLESNLKCFKEYGIKITKNRLLQFCKEYNITLVTDKEIRDMKVIQLYQENNTLSSRELEKLCKADGIKISYKTIQTILNKFKDGKK